MYRNLPISHTDTFFRRVVSSVFLVVVLLIQIAPLPVVAQVVTDPTDLPFDIKSAIEETVGTSTEVKEEVRDTFLKTLAYSVANQLLQKVVSKTINWANTGFEGNPFYVQNADETFGNIALQNATYIADAFRKNLDVGYNRQVLLSLADQYSGIFADPARSVDYTLPAVLGGNEQADAFNNGDIFSWDAYKVLNEAGNNPYTAALGARTLIESQIKKSQDNLKEELRTGGGFLSDKVCAPGAEVALSDGTQTCTRYITNTPGAVVASKVTDAVKSDNAQLQAAITASAGILSASVTQLTSSLLDTGLAQVGKIGSGDPADPNYQATWNTITAVESGEPSTYPTTGSGGALLGNANEVSIRELLYGTWRYGANAITTNPIGQIGQTGITTTLGQGTIIGDTEVTDKTVDDYVNANVYDISRMGMIDRTQTVIHLLMKERVLLYGFRTSVMNLDRECLLGPDRGYKERFDSLYNREISTITRRASNGNDQAERKLRAYEFIRSVMFKNIQDSMMSGGDDTFSRFSARMGSAVNKIDTYNDRIFQVERLLVQYQSVQNDLRRLEAEFISGATDKNEIARLLVSKQNSGQIPTTDVIFDQKNYIQSALGEKTYLENEYAYCKREIKKPEYQLHRWADTMKMLYCPLEGITIEQGSVPLSDSVFFQHILDGRVGYVNGETTGLFNVNNEEIFTDLEKPLDTYVLFGASGTGKDVIKDDTASVVLLGLPWFGGCVTGERGYSQVCYNESRQGRAIDFHAGERNTDSPKLSDLYAPIAAIHLLQQLAEAKKWDYTYSTSQGTRTESIEHTYVRYDYKYEDDGGAMQNYEETLKIECSAFYRSTSRDYESIYDRLS